MMDDSMGKTMAQVRAGLPLYLTAQGITLLLTFLDFPVYVEAYTAGSSINVTPWVGLWLALELFGLSVGLFLLIFKRWRSALPDKERGRLVAGYFLGAIAGLATLGLRYIMFMPPPYFIVVAGLLAVLVIAYWAWNRRSAKGEEIFP